MDIHDMSMNLEVINNEKNGLHKSILNPSDNLYDDETNTNINMSIHDKHLNKNVYCNKEKKEIVMNANKTKFNKYLLNRIISEKIENDKNKYININKFKVKQMIRAERLIKNNQLNKKSYQKKYESYSDELKKLNDRCNSCNFDDCKLEENNNFALSKFTPSEIMFGEKLRNNLRNIMSNSSNKYDNEPNNLKIEQNLYFINNDEQNKKIIEEQKNVNLPEIITGVLQDVISNGIKNIDDVIGKLRISYEEKNIFTNINKKNVILLNFEDDTIRPVLEINQKYIDIINEWYELCDLILEIENTNISIPEAIIYEDISGVLFQDINLKYKNEYLNNYLPIVINNIISSKIIKDYEKKYFNDIPQSSKKIKNFLKNKISNDEELEKLGIQIPLNIKNNYIDNSNNNCTNIPNSEGKIEYLTQPNKVNASFENFKKQKECIIQNTQINCFNEIYSNNFNDLIVPYNFEYDSLKPAFYDTCCSFESEKNNNENEKNNETNENKKEHELNIFVLLNTKFLQTIVLTNPSSEMLYVMDNHIEYGFVKLFNVFKINEDIENFINNAFNKIQFNTIEEINTKLIKMSHYIEFSNKLTNSNNETITEETQVKKYIKNNYDIDNDINNKMKASTLHDNIINSKQINIESSKINGFKTRLSKYLKDLGLEKKRYNDGYYYYGIQLKPQQTNKSPFNNGMLLTQSTYVCDKINHYEYSCCKVKQSQQTQVQDTSKK